MARLISFVLLRDLIIWGVTDLFGFVIPAHNQRLGCRCLTA
jgi:hypothetical protein